ncbi:MAG: YdbL family protein [Pseudomonadales bacterium]
MKHLQILIFSLGLMLAALASALDLNTAKQQGLVGEQRNGLLGAVNTQRADVADLVQLINARRVVAYQKIARKNGTQLQIVQSLAGKKAIEKTPKGQYVRPGQSWKKVP